MLGSLVICSNKGDAQYDRTYCMSKMTSHLKNGVSPYSEKALSMLIVRCFACCPEANSEAGWPSSFASIPDASLKAGLVTFN